MSDGDERTTADVERTAKLAPEGRSNVGRSGSPDGTRAEMLFWKRRLKSNEHSTDWSLSYGDLMSLLLAVFVMIAAMSELKGGDHYLDVAGSVQRAFGFTVDADRPGGDPLQEMNRPRTLRERLEQLDRDGGLDVRLSDGTDRPIAPCRMRSEPGRIEFRIPVEACFEDSGTDLAPPAERLLSVLADHLDEGGSSLEVRLQAGDEPLPRETPWRDAHELAYERGRALSAALMAGGIEPGRITLTVSGKGIGSACVKIVVRTDPTAVENETFADGERNDHG